MKLDLTNYDIKPEAFINYLRYYGEHFNKKLCEFACSHFPECSYDKNKIDEILSENKIKLKYAKLHDAVYAINYLKTLFYNSGITDEKNLLKALQSLFDKEGDLLFNRWYADMAKSGIPIEWEDMI